MGLSGAAIIGQSWVENAAKRLERHDVGDTWGNTMIAEPIRALDQAPDL